MDRKRLPLHMARSWEVAQRKTFGRAKYLAYGTTDAYRQWSGQALAILIHWSPEVPQVLYDHQKS